MQAVEQAKADINSESNTTSKLQLQLTHTETQRDQATAQAEALRHSLGEVQEKLQVAQTPPPPPPPPPAPPVIATVECECCGNDDILETEAIKIDSGQIFCSDCLKALRG
jgi:small-conductance mechanosensitive channel